jgi:hypothetical protein
MGSYLWSDNNLWITESRGYKVYKMDPNTGAKTTVLDISMGSTWLPAPSDTLMFNSIVTGHREACWISYSSKLHGWNR